MSEYEDDDDTGSDEEDVIDMFKDSFACLSKVKSNTPRARFDVHFYAKYIRLIQYSVQKQVSHDYCISKDNISEMLRLPYSNGKYCFFVLHLKRPIVGGNRSGTKYDFVVFNFATDEHEQLSLDLSNPTVRDMFDEDIVNSETIAGQTIDVFETILVKIYAKDVTTPAKNYDGNKMAKALPCTFWDNDEHFLYPLDDGFVNVWKYCQKLKLKEVKDVRFVRSQGRFKTFDFYIYPTMNRNIRRYHIGAGESRFLSCFYLEFKAIDQTHYDGLFAYCGRNKITVSTNDFRESASDTNSDDGSDSPTETDRNATESDDSSSEELIDDNYEAPDPHMVQCKREGRESESGNNSSSEENESESTPTSEDETPAASQEGVKAAENNSTPQKRRRNRSKIIVTDESSSEEDELTPTSDDRTPATSQESVPVAENNIKTQQRRVNRSRNIIVDETSGSSSDSVIATPRKRSLRVDSDDEIPDDKINQNKSIKKEENSD